PVIAKFGQSHELHLLLSGHWGSTCDGPGDRRHGTGGDGADALHRRNPARAPGRAMAGPARRCAVFRFTCPGQIIKTLKKVLITAHMCITLWQYECARY